MNLDQQLVLSLSFLSREINELHAELCALGKTSLEKAIRIGELLTEAKGTLRHGQWLPWLKTNIEFSKSTAYNYIGLFENREKFPKFGNLTDAYALLLNNETKAEERAAKREAFQERLLLAGLANGSEPLPGPFEIVLADPPWRYEGVTTTPDRTIEQHYPTCSVDQIAAHCPDSAQNSVLFLWATAPLLPEALEVMACWGFRYKTNAVWDKKRIGMGYWFRIQHEHLLVGVKGDVRVPPEEARVSSIFSEPRTRHSTKPLAVYEWIETTYPDKAKLEMYCRCPRHGWTNWGNETGV